MKLITNLISLVLLASLSACGQIGDHSHKEKNTMDTTKITNELARKAIDAWQDADHNAWNAIFTKNPTLLDDGNPRDFVKFSKEMGSEYFTTIDKVENEGKDVFGHFHSDTWGDFKTYFKFTINNDGKIEQLQIGQANY